MYDLESTKCDLEINPSDIQSDVIINTLHPVEKFTLYWRISNYSKILYGFNEEFSTTSKSTTWKAVLRVCLKRSEGVVISLLRICKGNLLHVQYTAETKTCHQTLEQKGKYKFRENDMIPILKIPFYETDPEVGKHPIRFVNDVVNFKCTMEIIGHTITNKTCLRNSLHPSISQLASDFRSLLKSEQHCDMVVSVGNTKIPVHKSILCARSRVFNIMFQHDMLESKDQEVQVDDIDVETFRDFLSFLYSGKIEFNSLDKAMKLYYAADKYQLTDLRNACSEFLQLNMTVNEVCSVLVLADQHKDDKLKESATFFILMNISAVKLTNGWKDLLRTNPKLVVELKI